MKKYLIFLFIAARLFLTYWYGNPTKTIEIPSYVNVQIIELHPNGRTGRKLEKVRDIVIHYVGNPGTTAQGNHDYFSEYTTPVSSHFIVGLEGEIIQAIPLDEYSSASNWRNYDTISIEVCHLDESGQFTEVTTEALVTLCKWLLETYHLDSQNLIRHFDVTGKACPLYFVTHPEAWEEFKERVQSALEKDPQSESPFTLLHCKHQLGLNCELAVNRGNGLPDSNRATLFNDFNR